MNPSHPKYSIIIPIHNGFEYLPCCIETIISQKYSDYELILSDDNSTDGTRDFLNTLDHANISVIYPTESLSMTEHWEWALSHAKGEWQIFVGQDDGLQPYFFQLADRLIEQACTKGLRTIMSSRAYFFWKGCEYIYGDVVIDYLAFNKTTINNYKFEALKALLGFQDYFELPQMYTTAIFHKDLLSEVRSKQNGSVFSCHPQDANLAAIACSLERKYLKSNIPLGWVGSSTKSAGMAISGTTSSITDKQKQKRIESLKDEYLNKVTNSSLKYHQWAGDFSFGSGPLYFWQALLMTQHLRSQKTNKIIKSPVFKVILFSRILYTKKFSKNKRARKYFQQSQFDDLLTINQCNKYIVLSLFIANVVLAPLIDFLTKVVRKIGKLLLFNKIRVHINQQEHSKVNIVDASKLVNDRLIKKKWF